MDFRYSANKLHDIWQFTTSLDLNFSLICQCILCPSITVMIKLDHVGNIILYVKSLYNINLLSLPVCS